MKKILFFVLFLFVKNIFAQKQFECGTAYYTVGDGSGTDIYKVIQNTNGILSASFLVRAEKDFNGVGYRRQDNLMYAVNGNRNSDNKYNFYQIDATGKVNTLKKLPLSTQYSYFSGDVTVDGKYYVALANGATPSKLYLVDLTDPNYALKELTFPAGISIGSPDIAFSPDGLRLFAYQTATKKLLEIDYNNASIVKEYENNSSITDNYSGMWTFDCALYGYSRNYKGFLKSELEGIKNPIGFMSNVGDFSPPKIQSIDGCSCPPPVKFFKHAKKTINPDTCITEIKFYFTIDNKCGIEQKDILFRDIFPNEFIITNIDKNPFGGIIKQGVGGNTLVIENMNIPNRRDTMVITTRLKPTIDKEFYKNQAFLDNIRHQDGAPISIKSDDPFTPEYLDSTLVKAPLFVKFSNDTISLCPDNTAKIKPKIEGENPTYLWNTGEKSAEITVRKAGIYSVTVTSDCEIKIDTQVVINQPLTLEIGKNFDILPGDSVLIFPKIDGYNPLKNFQWIPSNGANLKSKTILNNVARPNVEESIIGLNVMDIQGCMATDNLRIKLRRNLYIPNTFSPDDNQVNDYFYIFTEANAQVELFEIFDRWGSKVFSKMQCPTNDPLCGWDGTYLGKKTDIGVFTYHAKVLFLDGVSVDLKGDVMLLR